MIEHPAKFWIKFLLTRKKHSVEGIEGMLTALDLGGAEEEYIQKLESGMDYPDPFFPTDLRHKASQYFLRREGVHDAWHNSPVFREAYSVLGTGEVRPLVETYILSPLRPNQAVKKISQQTNVKLSVRAYELFEHYWWNRSLLSGAGWGQYIMERDVAHQEWLQLAVHARGAQGAQMLMWKTGSAGRLHVESGRMFKDIRDISYMCIKQIEHRYPTEEHARTLLNYARACHLSQQQLDASANAVTDIVDSFNAFRMRRVSTQIPSVQQLTRGNVSEAEDVAGERENLGDY